MVAASGWSHGPSTFARKHLRARRARSGGSGCQRLPSKWRSRCFPFAVSTPSGVPSCYRTLRGSRASFSMGVSLARHVRRSRILRRTGSIPVVVANPRSSGFSRRRSTRGSRSSRPPRSTSRLAPPRGNAFPRVLASPRRCRRPTDRWPDPRPEKNVQSAEPRPPAGADRRYTYTAVPPVRRRAPFSCSV